MSRSNESPPNTHTLLLGTVTGGHRFPGVKRDYKVELLAVLPEWLGAFKLLPAPFPQYLLLSNQGEREAGR